MNVLKASAVLQLESVISKYDLGALQRSQSTAEGLYSHQRFTHNPRGPPHINNYAFARKDILSKPREHFNILKETPLNLPPNIPNYTSLTTSKPMSYPPSESRFELPILSPARDSNDYLYNRGVPVECHPHPSHPPAGKKETPVPKSSLINDFFSPIFRP